MSSGKVLGAAGTAQTSPNQGGGIASNYVATYSSTTIRNTNHATPTTQQTIVTLIKSDPFTIGIESDEHKYEIVLYPEGDIDITLDGQPAATRSATVSNLYDNIKQHIKETGGLF